jgi:DNA-binding NtrC family response regulator
VFLDEVGELPSPVQVKLLRVIEDRKVSRIGGRTPRKLDVRFVAATNRNLDVEVTSGTFRQDLYFRLNGISFVIPPLRDRIPEIAPLAELFLAAASRTLDRTTPLALSPEALGYLERHAWPGNVRELRNIIERAAVLSSGDSITPADLPVHITRAELAALPSPAKPVAVSPASRDPSASEAATERQRVIDALDQCAGNQTRAAKLLGISLRTLVNRLKKHEIPRPRSQPRK